MLAEADRERMRQLLVEALPMLCKSGLNFSSEFCVEALIGITLDKNDVMLVSIKETVNSPEHCQDSASERSLDVSVTNMTSGSASPGHLRRNRKRRHSASSHAGSDSEDNSCDDFEDQSKMKREKHDFTETTTEHETGNDFHDQCSSQPVFVKAEPKCDTEYRDMGLSHGESSTNHGFDRPFNESNESFLNQTFPGTSRDTNISGAPMLPNQHPGLLNTSLDSQSAMTLMSSFGIPGAECHGNSFKQLKEALAHQLPKRGWLCKACHQEFSRKDSLSRHIRVVHLKEKNLKCSYCSWTFANKTNKIIHENRCKVRLEMDKNQT